MIAKPKARDNFTLSKVAEVYFSKEIGVILDRIDYSSLGNKVAIKVHFGEKGCTTFLPPHLAKKLAERITETGREAVLVDCNVLYKGSRTNKEDHLRTAKEHGFDLPIDILDGELGEEFCDINGCKLGAGLLKYDSLVVLSHFKGHIMAGFGGAVKNIGMGLGSRAGKLHMHATVKPSIGKSCVGCGVCKMNCNSNAIEISGNPGMAVIVEEKCVGCAMCIAVCPNGAATVPWGSQTPERLQEKIGEYARAVKSHFSKIICINALKNITKDCDCLGVSQKPVMQDIGFVYSTDMVAVDKASLDLAEKFSNGRFSKINSIEKNSQFNFYERLGLGSLEYELIEL